jgi:diaminopimelate epimerase
MHGLGNDFIVLDLRSKVIPRIRSVVKNLSNRRFGIGFDQALVLKKSRKADFKMEIYNSDGSKVEMCGNGIRCIAAYIWKRRLSTNKKLEIETLAGIIVPEQCGKLVKVDMGLPVLEGRDIPVKATGQVIDKKLKAGDKSFSVTCVSMGNPHAVIFVKDVDTFPLGRYGRLLEKHAFFPNGVNVEFVEVVSPGKLKVRVWERGAGATLACGTGACAAQVAANLKGLTKRSVSVALPGGTLKISIGKDSRVFMTGPATEVFTGTIEI